MKVLVLCTYPSGDASRRLRIDPIVAHLRQREQVTVHTLLTQRAFQLKNHRILKFYSGLRLLWGLIERLVIVLCARPDVLLVHREVFPFFTPMLERIAARNAKLSVIDLDDAIFTEPTHSRDWRRLLRKPSGALEYASIFDLKLVGNRNLAESMGSGSVYQFPTCPEPRYAQFRRAPERLIVWVGSASTLGNIEAVLGETLEVCSELNYQLLVVGAQNVRSLPSHDRLNVSVWTPEVEQDALRRGNLGVMPLSETDWDRGKSGYKAILYMVSGMHAFVSPVGINADLASRYYPLVRAAGASWGASLRETLVELDERGSTADLLMRARRDFDSEAQAREASGLIRNEYKNARGIWPGTVS